MEESFNERFKKILKNYDLSAAEVGRRMGISRQVIDSYLKNTVPRYDTLVLILKAFPLVDIKWLLLGDTVSPATEVEQKYIGDKQKNPKMDYELLHRLWMEDRQELAKLRDINYSLTQLILHVENKTNEVFDTSPPPQC